MTLRPSAHRRHQDQRLAAGRPGTEHAPAPLRLDVDVDQLDPVRAQALVDHPERLSGLQSEVTRDVQDRHPGLAAALVRRRRLRRDRPRPRRLPPPAPRAGRRRPRPHPPRPPPASARTPPGTRSRYSNRSTPGCSPRAPQVVGNARSIVTEFDVYQQELARLVTNVTKLYDVDLDPPRLPAGPGHPPRPARLRHPSQPGGLAHHRARWWTQYRIDVIIDSGDTMDHGSRRREPLPRRDRRPRRPLRLGARQPRLGGHPALCRGG